jgi:excisionase family DNA binding protein
MSDITALLTVQEVAAYLRLNTLTVYDYIRSGLLKAIKFGRTYRIDKDDLDKFIESNKTY